MSDEESVKRMKGNKDSGAVMDVNGDLQNFDTQHNSGGGGIVVMRGGKPELYGQTNNSPRTVPTKEELENKDNDPNKTTVRVTALPDMLGEDNQEEQVVSTELPKTNGPKQVTRIDVTKESLESPTPEIKKKRGRPRKS